LFVTRDITIDSFCLDPLIALTLTLTLSMACESRISSHVRVDERFWSQASESGAVERTVLSLYVHAGYIMRPAHLYTVSQRITSPLSPAESSDVSTYVLSMRS